ncbi:MAG TPA: thiamine-phosphate kinase [Chitinophagales bacterium]|nr:thiamine-phosphate kinase [Chitinophagales bacterium]MBP6154146.1 thiamine-phosphate kinase [Chitinophagales bacterium]HQV77224.1 thiamine-phosphate kinase [Chitinophagales bacterium]HQW79723.1 thiamine-phosphate kinase [Chitinophagales bacterium]HRB66378.1 thiamine-phosphate kinase [Chitinophagales bacterium]
MEKTKRTEISSLGEFGLIDRITKNIELQHTSTIKGIGDDAAIIQAEKTQVITTDILVEGIHFDLVYTPLKHLGYKSVIVNLSDVYAMNAIPKQILVSLAISNRFSVEAIEEIYEGIKLACKKYKVDLIGGDTTASQKGLIINVVAIGEQEKEKIVSRNSAKEGDLLCVSGDLGAAYMGLTMLQREKQVFLNAPEASIDLSGNDFIVGKQLKPEARKDVIEFFAEQNIVPTSMIDISDGLSSEILHICKQSNVGCQLNEDAVPIASETYNKALEFGIDPINCALSGGEDYELLFTILPSDRTKVKQHPDISIIGEILDSNLGVKLFTKGGNYHDIISLGWNSLKDED